MLSRRAISTALHTHPQIPGLYRIVQLVRKAKAGYAGSPLDFWAPPGIRLDPAQHQQAAIAGGGCHI